MTVAQPEVMISGETDGAPPREWTAAWPQTPSDFEELIGEFQDRLVRYAFCRLRDLCEAEDVVQEVFVKAFTARHELRDVRPVAPYLYRMVANMCVDRLRRPRPVMVPMDEAGADSVRDGRARADERAAAAEQLRRADDLLARLPRRQAEVLRLRVIDDLSLSEIADIHGCPLATVKSRMRYGVDRLRRILSRRKERAL